MKESNNLAEENKLIKVRYVRDEKSAYFKKGEIYSGRPSKGGISLIAFYYTEEENDEAGWYAFPAWWFEIVN